MLNKILITALLSLNGFAALHAGHRIQVNSNQAFCCGDYSKDKEKRKDLTPGALVCNGAEDRCVNREGNKESDSSILFSVFCEDSEDEQQLLSCKGCQ